MATQTKASIRTMTDKERALFELRVRELAAVGKSAHDVAALLSLEFRSYKITYHTIKNVNKTLKVKFLQVNGEAVRGPLPPTDVEAEVSRLLGQKAAEFLEQHRPLEPVPENVKTTRLEEMGYDSPVETVIPFHDLHYGSFIDPRVSAGLAHYNIDIARERLKRWRNLVLRFTQREQLTTTVKEGHVLAIGDDFEGHGKMFGTQAFGMEETVGFQYLGFVDYASDILLDLLSRYDHLTVYKVHGNHGRVAGNRRDDYPPDNIELMAWQNIADRVRKQTGGEWQKMSQSGIRVLKGGMIDFYIASSPIMLVEILGWKFLIMHGHGIKGLQSTYTGVIDTKLRYNAILGETINYLVKAHLHESQSSEHEIGGSTIQGGCFVGPSLLSLRGPRPMANLPSQELFFMHPKHGKVHHEQLHLATIEEMRDLIEWVGRPSNLGREA